MSVDAALLEVFSTVHNNDQFRPFSPFGSLNINLWYLFTYVIYLYIFLSVVDWFQNTFWPEWMMKARYLATTTTALSGGDPPESSPGITELAQAELPKHVAIIMDGNRRWATSRGLPKLLGHKAGVENLERIIVAASKIGNSFVKLFCLKCRYQIFLMRINNNFSLEQDYNTLLFMLSRPKIGNDRRKRLKDYLIC